MDALKQPEGRPGPLTPGQEKVLARVCSYRPGWWADTSFPITKPLPAGITDMVAKGLIIVSDKGRTGPLGLRLDMWIIAATDQGRVLSKMLTT